MERMAGLPGCLSLGTDETNTEQQTRTVWYGMARYATAQYSLCTTDLGRDDAS